MRELEAKAGLGKNSLPAYKSGARMPSADALRRIAEAAGCDPGWLLTGFGEPWPTVVDGDRVAVAIETATASFVRSAHYAADAAAALLPMTGRAALLAKLTLEELQNAAWSLRDAATLIDGVAGSHDEGKK